MGCTKELVKKEFNKAQKRLETFSSHTGFEYKLDKDILNWKSRKKAVEYLKSIKWSNMGEIGIKAEAKMLKHVEVKVSPKGPESFGLESYIVQDKAKLARLIDATKERQKAETKYIQQNPDTDIKLFKPNPYTEKNFQGQIDYALEFASIEKLEEWEENRDAHALNNYVNNMESLANNAPDYATKATGIALARLINDKTIDIISFTRHGMNKWIWDLTAVNVYDSDQYDNIDAVSGKRLIDDFVAHGLLTKNMIANTYLTVAKNEKSGIDTLEMYKSLKELEFKASQIEDLFKKHNIYVSKNLQETIDADKKKGI